MLRKSVTNVKNRCDFMRTVAGGCSPLKEHLSVMLSPSSTVISFRPRTTIGTLRGVRVRVVDVVVTSAAGLAGDDGAVCGGAAAVGTNE